jgi:hypothetical protein
MAVAARVKVGVMIRLALLLPPEPNTHPTGQSEVLANARAGMLARLFAYTRCSDTLLAY